MIDYYTNRGDIERMLQARNNRTKEGMNVTSDHGMIETIVQHWHEQRKNVVPYARGHSHRSRVM